MIHVMYVMQDHEIKPAMSTMNWQLPLWKACTVTWPLPLSPTQNEFGIVWSATKLTVLLLGVRPPCG